MQRRSIKITTLLVLFSMLTIFLEFGALYFIDNILLVFGLSAILVIFMNHIALELAISYDANFVYNILTILESSIVIILLYFKPDNRILPYQDNYILLIAINWIFPVSYCILRNLWDKGPRYINFVSFFRKMSIIFLIYYLIIGALKLFIQPWNLSNTAIPASNFSLIPFYTIASHIEGFYYKTNDLRELLIYVTKYIIYFIPLGFYTSLIFRNRNAILRYLLILLLAAGIETGQYLLNLGRFDIDDILLAFIGCVIGTIAYNIINAIYLSKKDYKFLEEPSRYSNYIQKYFN